MILDWILFYKGCDSNSCQLEWESPGERGLFCNYFYNFSCNFSVGLKLFQNKNIAKVFEKTQQSLMIKFTSIPRIEWNFLTLINSICKKTKGNIFNGVRFSAFYLRSGTNNDAHSHLFNEYYFGGPCQ